MSDDLTPGTDTQAFVDLSAGIATLLAEARRRAARSVNALMTATYWEIGRRIVEFEQKGAERAEYGERVIERLSKDLTARFGRGFGIVNLSQMRRFHLTWTESTILQTLSEKLQALPETPGAEIVQTASGQLDLETLAAAF